MAVFGFTFKYVELNIFSWAELYCEYPPYTITCISFRHITFHTLLVASKSFSKNILHQKTMKWWKVLTNSLQILVSDTALSCTFHIGLNTLWSGVTSHMFCDACIGLVQCTRDNDFVKTLKYMLRIAFTLISFIQHCFQCILRDFYPQDRISLSWR